MYCTVHRGGGGGGVVEVVYDETNAQGVVVNITIRLNCITYVRRGRIVEGYRQRTMS